MFNVQKNLTQKEVQLLLILLFFNNFCESNLFEGINNNYRMTVLTEQLSQFAQKSLDVNFFLENFEKSERKMKLLNDIHFEG